MLIPTKAYFKFAASLLVSASILTGCSTFKGVEKTQPNASLDENVVVYDTLEPKLGKWMKDPAILVFHKTMGFRHDAGIAGGDKFFADLASERRYGLFTTENSAVFNDDQLSRFKVIVFNSMTGDALSEEQEAALQRWIEKGGAWIGIHAAGDHSQIDWQWYIDRLIGPAFVGHPSSPGVQPADLVVLDEAHPILRGIPKTWEMTDEWYSYDSRPQDHGMRPLMAVDETSYEPIRRGKNIGMGSEIGDHPIVWSSCVGEGRVVYSGLGHTQYVYDSKPYRKLLNNIFDWVQKKGPANAGGC